MSRSDTIRFAGDVNIDNISVVTSKGMTQNITNQVISIEIYEDLFSPVMTGVAVVRESFDLVNLLPFIGEEFLNVKIFTPSFDKKDYIDQQFYIFKIANRILTGDRSVYYEVHFISKEAIVDANKKISKAYGGLVSDIAKELFTSQEHGLETSKNVVIEPTSNRTKFISNYWSPLKSLQYAAGTAATSNGSANYLVYENRRGLNFNSLELLYSQKVYQKFVQDNYARDVDPTGKSTVNLNKDYQRIVELDVPILTNYLEKTSSGMFASKMVGSDPTMKRYFSKNFDMLEDFTRTTHLNTFAPATNKIVKHPNAAIVPMEKNYNPFNGYTDVSNAKTIQRRISQLMQAQNGKIEINVLGRTDYTVGLKVNVTLYLKRPIAAKEASSDTIDKVLSGDYIISAINHRITRDKHECNMELIKDSYLIDINKGGN